VPGGQAVQRADDFVPVRNAEMVLSAISRRALMAAYWYGGWDSNTFVRCKAA
jgi:hypothetical protein